MSEPETRAATKYFGSPKHGLDEKRRVQIPVKWRPEKADVELTLVVWMQHKAGACIRVLPPEEFAKALDFVESLPNSERKVLLKRFIGSESEPVTLDKAGRIVIPEAMVEAAGIGKEVVLAGCVSCFEIWSPERHQNRKAADAQMASEAFNLLG